MSETIHINYRPTFDLTEIIITHIDYENQLCYFESVQVFQFDRVYGNLENRSRIIRLGKIESEIVEQVISATIDAGYCGNLVWKTKLTKKGTDMLKKNKGIEDNNELFKNCQQIHLFSSPAGNYYNGSNQTDLTPNIVFT